MRNGGYVYNNLRRTTPLNDGKYNIKYNFVFTREKETDFKLRQPSEQTNHLYRLPVCLVNQPECTLFSRKQARRNYNTQFNTVMQVEDTFFKDRNLDNNFIPLTHDLSTKYKMNKFNVTENFKFEMKQAKDQSQLQHTSTDVSQLKQQHEMSV